MDRTHVNRVREELKKAGVGAVGFKTSESKEIAKIINDDEHIGGVVYGRYENGIAWLVATDQRVLFIDKKPLFTTSDELTYDVVSGVKSTQAGPFTGIILHTRVADYAMRYVSPKCARIFVKFIEKRRLKSGQYDYATGRYTHTPSELPKFQITSAAGLKFLKEHDLAVLSTVDRTGNVHGAFVYYVVDQNNLIYILTKSDTGKGRNVLAHSQVALTVNEPGTMQTVQLQGVAEVETDQKTKDKVFTEIVKPRSYRGEVQLPPVTKLNEGSFMVVRITPSFISYHDYTKSQ